MTKTNSKARQSTKRILLVAVSTTLALCSACSNRARVVDIITVSDEAKLTSLRERVDKFNRARYWGGAREAVSFVANGKRGDFMESEASIIGNQKIVKTEVKDLYLEEDGRGYVESEIQYVQQPTFLVRSHTERQTWVFDRFGGGWFLRENERTSEDKVKETGPEISASGLGR